MTEKSDRKKALSYIFNKAHILTWAFAAAIGAASGGASGAAIEKGWVSVPQNHPVKTAGEGARAGLGLVFTVALVDTLSSYKTVRHLQKKNKNLDLG